MSELLNARLTELQSLGAINVDPSFSVSAEDRLDIILCGRRYLAVENGPDFQAYRALLHGLDLPALEPDSHYSDEGVVVGEVSRDVRTVRQIARSFQPEVGLRTDDVFYMIGSGIGRIATEGQAVPDPELFGLRDVVVMRKRGTVMFLPPMHLVQATPSALHRLSTRLRNETDDRYRHFSGGSYLINFELGLHEQGVNDGFGAA